MSITTNQTINDIEAIPAFDEQVLETRFENAESQNGSGESGIASIGINGTSLIFQIINFIILFLLLKKFLFNPVGKVLEERRQKIQESLDNAAEIQKQKDDWKNEYRDLQNQASQKTAKIIDEAKQGAQKMKQEIIEEARKEQENMLENAKAQIQSEKTKSIDEIKNKIADLVGLAVEKVTKQTVDSKKDKDIISKSIKEII